MSNLSARYRTSVLATVVISALITLHSPTVRMTHGIHCPGGEYQREYFSTYIACGITVSVKEDPGVTSDCFGSLIHHKVCSRIIKSKGRLFVFLNGC